MYIHLQRFDSLKQTIPSFAGHMDTGPNLGNNQQYTPWSGPGGLDPVPGGTGWRAGTDPSRGWEKAEHLRPE